MAFPLKISLVTALLLLTACRSDPIQFHTLTPTQLSGASGGAWTCWTTEVSAAID